MKKSFILSLLICFSFYSQAQTFSWNGNEPIMDMQRDSIPIVVSGLPSTIDSAFGLAHICMTITHTYIGDLIIRMVSPNGDSVTLIHGVGGGGDNFTGTCVGVDGTFFSNTVAPFNGLFQPFQHTSLFNNGQNPNGIWHMIVMDGGLGDTGSVHIASIEFTNNPPIPNGTGGSIIPTGTYLCPTCVCPGAAFACDLLPDMTSSAKEIQLNHQETPGLLYLSNATPNIGYGPLEIYGIDSCFCGATQVPCGTICPGTNDIQNVIKQRIYQKVPGNDTLSYYDRIAGLMTYHAAHGHLHVDDFVNYTLRTATSNPDATTWPIVGTGTKQSFCLINLGTCVGNVGQCKDLSGNTITTLPNQNLGFHTGCGLTQGIYVGNYDVYSIGLNDPIQLNNVCNGTYYIVSITDPNDNFLESDETNNWVAVPITLTQQNAVPVITPNGSLTICSGDSVTLTANTASNYLWSNGATTQSIVVNSSGTYTVSTNCGTSTSTSAPVTVSVIPPNSLPSVSIALTSGTNPSCLGVAMTFTASATNQGSLPNFQWKVDGVNVGNNSPTFSSSTLTNAQVLTCELTSNLNCLATNTAVSNSILVNVGTVPCYCTPIYGTTGNSGCLDGDVIARVQLNTLDNMSGAGCPSGIAGYSDYSASSNPLHTTTLQAGLSYSITVQAGQYGQGYKAWIDYNDDGIFSTSEAVGSTTGIVAGSGALGVLGSSGSFSFSVACNAKLGNHRLRVRSMYNSAGTGIEPCIYQNNYGEAEDYIVTVMAPLGCAAPYQQSAINITSSGAALGWNSGCIETQWALHLTTAGGGAPTGTPSNPNVFNNPFIATGLTPNTSYEFWVAANCTSSGNGFSTWTGPFTFTTLSLCSTVPGTSITNPIIIGQVPCVTLPYINTQTNTLQNCFSNNYSGANNQASPDVWYQFTLANPATVQISHCTSGFDTYLHLLNSSGTQLSWNDDNGPLCPGLRASISSTLAAGTYYIVSEGYGTFTGAITLNVKHTDVCPTSTTLNLTCFIEGYWNGVNAMLPVLSNQGITSAANTCDTITVELHAAAAPYAMLHSIKTILNKDGTASCAFPPLTNNFYIVIKHRSALETWSANPVAMFTTPITYNFSTSDTQAYGANQIEVSSNKWALYSGDLNYDENMDLLDMTILENSITSFDNGYFSTDLNGDGNVDLLDNPMLEANMNHFIFSLHP